MNKLPKLSESELKNIEYWLRYPQSYIHGDGYLVDIKAHHLNVLLEHYKHNTKPPEKKLTLKEYFGEKKVARIGEIAKLYYGNTNYVMCFRPTEAFLVDLDKQKEVKWTPIYQENVVNRFDIINKFINPEGNDRIFIYDTTSMFH